MSEEKQRSIQEYVPGKQITLLHIIANSVDELLVVLKNLTPIILFALLIVAGLKFIPKKMITGSIYFGKFVTALCVIGLAAIIIETLTGIVVIKGMAPIDEGISTVGAIAIVLAGAYPLVHFITKVFRKSLMKAGSLLGVTDDFGLSAIYKTNIYKIKTPAFQHENYRCIKKSKLFLPVNYFSLENNNTINYLNTYPDLVSQHPSPSHSTNSGILR